MAQGGFARDYQRAAAAKMKKAQEDLEKERQVIGKQVTNNVLPNLRAKLDEQVKQVENKLILKPLLKGFLSFSMIFFKNDRYKK